MRCAACKKILVSYPQLFPCGEKKRDITEGTVEAQSKVYEMNKANGNLPMEVELRTDNLLQRRYCNSCQVAGRIQYYE